MFVISFVGPARTFVDDGADLDLPDTWRAATLPAGLPFQFAARGPSGAAILVLDRSVPGGTTFDPGALVVAAQKHHMPGPVGASPGSPEDRPFGIY